MIEPFHYPTLWDLKFFRVALEMETWSKHPTTRVACVIVDEDHIQLSGGYNGLPRGVDDTKIKAQTLLPRTNSTTVHAEANAVASAARKGHALLGSCAYVTRPACSQCAALLIQAGVTRVLALHSGYAISSWAMIYGDWAENVTVAAKLFRDVGVQYYLVPTTTFLLGG